MKLGISFNAFSGCELLSYSLKQIKNFADFIIVIWQDTNYYGDIKIKDKDINIIYNLKNNKLIDKLYHFKIDKYAKTELEASIIEGQKREKARLLCKENNCTHSLDLDVDEFFIPREFQKAKQYIENNDIEYSIVEYLNYFKLPIFQGQRNPNHPRYSPFITKLSNKNIQGGHEYCTKIINGKTCSVDKSRGYNTNKIPFLFPYNEIMMHHMSYIRNSISEKWKTHPQRLESVNNNINFLVKEIENLNTNNLKLSKKFCELLYLGEVSIKQVPNYFNLPLTF